MSVRLLLLLSVPLLLGACESASESRQSAADAATANFPASQGAATTDTFLLPHRQVVTWQRIAAADFSKVPGVPLLVDYPYDSAADGSGTLKLEAARLNQTQGRVRRQGNSLFFYPSNAQPLHFPDSSCDCDSATSYRFLGALPRSEYWLAEIGYYEGGDYLLVHQRTGQHLVLDHYPSLSPSGRRVASATNVDIYETGGLSLWQLDAGRRPRLSWRRIAGWNPEEIRWADDRTLLLKTTDADSVGRTFTSYLRLQLPE